MNLDEMITLGTLKLKADLQGHHVERLFGEAFNEAAKGKMRSVCAMIAPALFDALEDLTDKLAVSKRQFIEAAILDAVEKGEAALATLQKHVEG